ncbi:DUF4056 domain-containing protein [Arsenophonus apicola]|uniref:DUF4056 domain-containing protein n=1 Tax=Arsenophonus apicola TaxID=2879119 RepID=UPI003CC90F3F
MSLKLFIQIICLCIFLIGCKENTTTSITIQPVLKTETDEEAHRVWPVIQSITPPQGLRPCCAFGYNLRVKLWQIPIPFYRIENIVEANKLGEHHYNDSFWGTLTAISGLSKEKLGILYTEKGGFIDIAHVKDTADYTLYLFTEIFAHLGENYQIQLDDELATRKIQLFATKASTSYLERYTLSAYLAAELAFELAAWHEIAQSYGYESVPGFSESISAFSPEDLYSNLLGARIALTLILQGQASSVAQFSTAMAKILPLALKELGAYTKNETQQMFDQVDNLWWNSKMHVPEKFLLLKRDYETSSTRMPVMPPKNIQHGHKLSLPQNYKHYNLSQFAQLQLSPTKYSTVLPAKNGYWTREDFPQIAKFTEIRDNLALKQQ